MEPLDYIALLGALIQTGTTVAESVQKITSALQQNKEMTAEERAAFEQVMADAPSLDYWKPRS